MIENPDTNQVYLYGGVAQEPLKGVAGLALVCLSAVESNAPFGDCAQARDGGGAREPLRAPHPDSASLARHVYRKSLAYRSGN